MSFADELRSKVTPTISYDDGYLVAFIEELKSRCELNARQNKQEVAGYFNRAYDSYGTEQDFLLSPTLPKHGEFTNAFANGNIFAKSFHFNFSPGFKDKFTQELTNLGFHDFTVNIETVDEEKERTSTWRKKRKTYYVATGKKVQTLYVRVKW